MSYLERLKEHISEKAPCDQPSKPPKPGFVGFDGHPRGHISENYAKATLRTWHRHLSRLEPLCPPEGFPLNRWATLVEDCWWLYETRCSRLVRDGWSAPSLFGVLPSRPGWGGLADRLQGARNVLFDDTGRAFWTQSGVTFSTSRTAGNVPCGLVLVWKFQD